ncbi:LIC13197/LIC10919/LIC10469 family protein [Leptospira interrogans]|uniref:Uncharacterized protein n=1 Tax=Leptospira interrogans str. UI 12621 TaxID=1049937 RepID=A0A0F6H8T5_LEPIR|nr:hypothetical protein [Leptospira interrogans]EKO24667.1 hypothetical protein LEP1GSC104_3988 [Leptospira interrogans str. UI 12621]MBE0303827.1 hypothetical protein [Leptospira interrogans serovar Yeoncheon]
MKVDPTKFIKREEALKVWLRKNNQSLFLDNMERILNDLPKEEITEKFKFGLKSALIHCCHDQKIRELNFIWHNVSDHVSPAYAVGKDLVVDHQIHTENHFDSLKEIPKIETISNHGVTIELDFSLPTDVAINSYIKNLLPEILDMAMRLDDHRIRWNIVESFTDIVHIWNYKIGFEVCEELNYKNTRLNELKLQSPFWITLNEFDRWPVPIFVFSDF